MGAKRAQNEFFKLYNQSRYWFFFILLLELTKASSLKMGKVFGKIPFFFGFYLGKRPQNGFKMWIFKVYLKFRLYICLVFSMKFSSFLGVCCVCVCVRALVDLVLGFCAKTISVFIWNYGLSCFKFDELFMKMIPPNIKTYSGTKPFGMIIFANKILL